MKKFFLGFVWFIVIYFGVIIAFGTYAAFAGGADGTLNPENAAEAGRVAGERVVEEYGLIIFLIAFLAAVIGTVKGFLPGTKSKPTWKKAEDSQDN